MAKPEIWILFTALFGASGCDMGRDGEPLEEANNSLVAPTSASVHDPEECEHYEKCMASCERTRNQCLNQAQGAWWDCVASSSDYGAYEKCKTDCVQGGNSAPFCMHKCMDDFPSIKNCNETLFSAQAECWQAYSACANGCWDACEE